MKKRAFIFDLNGTMIDDMEFHVNAWFDILNNELGAGLSRDEVKSHMYGKNSELLERIFGKERFSNEEKDRLSVEKERRYQKAYLPHLALIDGLLPFLEKSQQAGIPMAVGTAAIPINVDFVLDALNLRGFFKTVVTADDVTTSKPHPETFLKCASLLRVAPEDCIVFEDAPKGVEAAANAGMKCVVLTTMHSKEEFGNYENIIGFTTDYKNLHPEALFDN